ncbi:hypothetical protein ACLKA7_000752 [Drosophila subpalustris]
MSDSNGQEQNGREANGQPPTKVRKINFTTNHDEPENSSGAQITELRREIDGLKKVVEELTEGMKTVVDVNKEVKAEIGFLAEMMGTQNAYLRQILQRGAQVTEAQGSTFPILTTEELMALNLKISPENRQIYITKMKELLLQATLSKSLKKILGEDIILDHNIEGVSKKKALNAYASFFPALLEAISLVDASQPAEKALSKAIQVRPSNAVSFVGIHFRVGYLVIDCTDQNSADWLLTVAPKLHSWKGVPLDCRMGDDIPSPHTITLYLPRSADRESGDLLVMLSNQNKIETDAWRVISRKEEGGGALLVLGIDEMAKNNIVARGHQLFFRFGKIPVSGLKRVAERDGMRAAPAPPEATALASEDPPPTGTNLETSPAASGSSVCPAGPSDSLEDLAEDEDLADLTLDPAAVEEIDEQMAMSSQELNEEMEGADVTLTPCDDEGNSRPPSSCDMEPLL